MQQCINITQLFQIQITHPEKEKEIFNNLLSKQVDGIIFLGGTITEEMKELINQSSVPVVVSGTNGKDAHIASVNIDFTEAAKEITGELIEKALNHLL